MSHCPFKDELLSVLTHLVVCAVEDPGVPNPLKQLTLLGQNLRQVEISSYLVFLTAGRIIRHALPDIAG